MLKSCADEIYPSVPSPSVVDVKFVDVTSPVAPLALDKYPIVPSPLTVDCRVESKRDVLTKPIADERYPKVPNPLTVDCKVEFKKGVLTRPEADDKYPNDPNPCVVLTKLLANPRLLMKFTVPNPTTVEASSVGSIKDEISV